MTVLCRLSLIRGFCAQSSESAGMSAQLLANLVFLLTHSKQLFLHNKPRPPAT